LLAELDRIVLIAASSIDDPARIRGRKLFIIARKDFYGSGRSRLPDIQDQFERVSD
jgi:hypothetical protein